MHKFDSAVGIVAITQVGTAGLPVGNVGTAVGFAIAVLARHPGLKVILAVFGRTHVAGADFQHLIRQFQILQNLFGNLQQFLMPLFAFVNVVFADNELFRLHKLVNPGQPAGIFAGSTGFAAEAGRKAGIKNRQFVFGNDFVGSE